METSADEMAWLSKRDGSVVIGHGPFVESAAAPEDGVAFYVQDFAMQDARPWKIPARIERSSISELAVCHDGPALDCEWESLDPAVFSVVFQEVMASIHRGEFEKTVPVVTETGIARHPAGTAIVAAMISQPAPLYSYGWVRGGSGFAGATPELLVGLRGSRLETMALAGTARSEDREVFAVDEKEILEHEFVARTLVAKLMELGHMERRSREILDLGSIVHFLTSISLELGSDQSPEDLIRRLHPTPALGPLPRNRETLALLLDWRERLGCPPHFGAPFGLRDGESFEAVVAIRGIWWDGNRLSLPAGCGVIEASRLVNEWRELRLKREAVKRFLMPRFAANPHRSKPESITEKFLFKKD